MSDAFRQYEPGGQRQRMVTLFLALCEEAQIVEPGMRRSTPPPARRAAKAKRVSKASPGGTGLITPGVARHGEVGHAPSVLFGVTEQDVAALDDQTFNEVWAALGKVARARAKASSEVATPVAVRGDEGEQDA